LLQLRGVLYGITSMHEGRQNFRNQLRNLEDEVQAMATAAERLFELSVRNLSGQDPALYQLILAGDDEVDAHYLSIESRVLGLLALQAPVVATDLRLLMALLHISLHLERVADMAVNIAKVSEAARRLPQKASMLQNLEEMGGRAMQMLEAAMDALAHRDVELSKKLPSMDEPIDRLNRAMLHEVLAAAGEEGMLEWCVDMHVVARQIERVGDHAVDMGEQLAFLVTGELREFTDASHPEVEHPPEPVSA